MKVYITIIILLFATNSSFSQVSFLGKQQTYYLGVSTPLLGMSSEYYIDDNTVLSFDNSFLPPSIELSFGKVKSSRINLMVLSKYTAYDNAKALRNISISEESITETFGDTLKIRSDGIDIGIELEIFSEYAPIGNFFSLKSGYRNIFGKIFPTYLYVHNDSEFQVIERELLIDNPAAYSTSHIFAGIGFGKSLFLSPKTVLKYGISSSLNFSLSSSKAYSLASEGGSLDDVVTTTLKRNINRSFLLEFYVKIGIIK